VVEQVGDVLSIEKTGQFRGLYHVLGGVISPMAGIAPSDLKIDLLINNIERGESGRTDFDKGEKNGNSDHGKVTDFSNMAENGEKTEAKSATNATDSVGGSGDYIPSGAKKGIKIREVILAISTTVEGETTLFYIMNRLKRFTNLKITTIARGIGFGDEIEYADELTISHAIANRREISQL
jgi:recombinational DNA repair protein RecR